MKEIETEINSLAERGEAEALAFLLRIRADIEAKINALAERSEAEALAFLVQN